MSGNLYQLRGWKRPIGTYYPVDGPYDTHGFVIAHKGENENGTLHLVRGTGRGEEGRWRAENRRPEGS